MVPTHRLLLILLLLVALHARAAGTALWKAWGTEGDAALQLGSGSATAGDGTGTSWLFPPLQSCPLTAQRSAGRAPLQVFPTGGLFQLLGWIRRKSLAGIPGRPTQWLCRSRRFQEEAVAHCPPLPQQGRRCKQRSKSKEHAPAPWGHRLETGGYPLRPVSPTSHPGIPDSWDQHQQPQPPPETPARPPSMAPTAPGSPSPGPI
ncbi:uncharacterized protein LOC122154674 isoform X3 [Tyto alba]|uniref:uncharacterized protein LOC122153135 isoform X3 n=1 Tax=Tyto alba TaxID=56313 RepID=UPI001C6853A3|nr:uncharacterized protein LOC122153135 isoform X3 [Tyto alba]XP_042660956.1 uncharacterized protein LOC122154670 isoform X3 [Tyto alba]XP_042660962.1 uncharacterized protein LOC122154674 isoform X3 [Tyto alba]